MSSTLVILLSLCAALSTMLGGLLALKFKRATAAGAGAFPPAR